MWHECQMQVGRNHLSEAVAQGNVHVCVVLELGEEGVRVIAEEDVGTDFDG